MAKSLPKISFEQLAENVQQSHYFVNMVNPPPVKDRAFPAIPPKLSAIGMTAPADPDEGETWYCVLSPRDTRGICGPFSVPQLRRMYKSGEVSNTTLFWAEGEDDWHQLMYQKTLKPKVLQLPVVPPKVGTFNAERAVYDPITQAPPVEQLDQAEDLKGFDITKCCFKCGSMAVAHIPTAVGNKPPPDLFKGRHEVGTTEFTAEVLPGLLWVGQAAAAKQRAILRIGITLVFNCTKNMKSPQSQPPVFRCREAPMAEAPKQSFTEEETADYLDLFERVYDQIELHRLTPELAAKSDPRPKEYRGPTDKLGMPIKTAADLKVLRRPNDDETPIYAPRILLWSRLGTERPCVLAAAYIIKHYAVTVEHAVHIVRANRTSTTISAPYLEVLRAWSARYTLGLLICIDCQAKLDSSGQTIGDTAFDAELRSREEAARRLAQLQRVTEEGEGSEDDSDIGFNDQRADQDLLEEPPALDGPELHADSSILDNSIQGSEIERKRTEYEQSLESTYNTFVQLMKSHMYQMLKDRPHELAVLSKVETYLHKIYTNSVGVRQRVPYFRWHGLMDLELSGRYLSDLTMAVLFQLLAGNNLIRQIRMLKLQSNLIESLALKALLIAYFPEGHMEDDNYFFDDSQTVADVDCSFDLMLLDLSGNKIDDYGVPYLQYFLKQCNTLTSLDVSNNKLGDFQCGDLLQCLARPPLDFDDRDEFYGGHSTMTEHMKPHNYSITSLNMSMNDLRENGVEQLVNTLKHNAVLRSLVLDLCPHITPREYKEIANAIRLYNSVLEELSFSENPLTVKSVEYISRIFDSKDAVLSKLVLTNCNLKHPHMTAFAKYVLSARYLRALDFSGNPLGDKGAEALFEMLVGKAHPLTSQIQPPLEVLDLSGCGFTPVGMARILDALSQRTSLQRVDLSDNHIGADNDDAYASLAKCRIPHLRLNNCQIHTKGAKLIFQALADVATPLAQGTRYLYLSGNEIADSCVDAMCLFLEKNTTLEALDLGFNLFTDRHGAVLRHACSVVSASTAEKKVSDLTINLVGNKCDPYMLETPGLSRSKSNFLFGVRPNAADPSNHGYSHIAHHSRGHFLARKELDNQFREHLPLSPINAVS